MAVPCVLLVSQSQANRVSLPKVSGLPRHRLTVVSNWDRAVSRTVASRIDVVITDSITFEQDREVTRAALQSIDAALVLVLGVGSLTHWARELRCQPTDRQSYRQRVTAALSPTAAPTGV